MDTVNQVSPVALERFQSHLGRLTLRRRLRTPRRERAARVVDHAVPGVFRIETDDAIIHVDSAKNAGSPSAALDACFEATMAEMIDEHGFGERAAYIQTSVNPNVTVRTYQFVPPNYFTFGVKVDKTLFDGVSD